MGLCPPGRLTGSDEAGKRSIAPIVWGRAGDAVPGQRRLRPSLGRYLAQASLDFDHVIVSVRAATPD